MRLQPLQNSCRKIVASFLILILIFNTSSCESVSIVKVKALKCEYKTNPLGIDNLEPRLSWNLEQENLVRGQQQTAYQVLVASNLENLENNSGDVWDSGKVETNQSVNNTFQGTPLESAKQYFWKVKVWDASGNPSDWSENAIFSMGLLKKEDWKGEWILKSDQKKTDNNWYIKNFQLQE